MASCAVSNDLKSKPAKAKLLFLETRPQFLILTPLAFSVGIGTAVYEGHFMALHFLLALVGAILAHVTVNVLNDYVDYVRGTDKLTQRTPFSGGSGLLPEEALAPKEALKLGLASLLLGLLIGIYFIIQYPLLSIIILSAALLTVLYTPLLTRAYITEIFPGLGFGPLLVMGAYVTQLPPGKVFLSPQVIWASIPVGILVSNLLWVNEIPDYEADLKTGRRHGVILLGQRKASLAYVLFLALAYLFIVIPVIFKILPPHVLLGLGTLPIALKAGRGAVENYNQVEKLIPALGQNVLVVLATPALMTIGFLLAA